MGNSWDQYVGSESKT